MEPFCQDQEPPHQLPLRATRPARNQPEQLLDNSFESDDREAWSQVMLALKKLQKAPKEPTQDLWILDSESEQNDDEEESEADRPPCRSSLSPAATLDVLGLSGRST